MTVCTGHRTLIQRYTLVHEKYNFILKEHLYSMGHKYSPLYCMWLEPKTKSHSDPCFSSAVDIIIHINAANNANLTNNTLTLTSKSSNNFYLWGQAKHLHKGHCDSVRWITCMVGWHDLSPLGERLTTNQCKVLLTDKLYPKTFLPWASVVSSKKTPPLSTQQEDSPNELMKMKMLYIISYDLYSHSVPIGDIGQVC